MTGDAAADLAAYRRTARSWIEGNLEFHGSRQLAATNVSPGYLEGERALQRTLHDAGYSGIAWPREFGGQGLSSSHERAFNEEAEYYRTPNFGVLGHTTFGICGPTMLAHAAREFLAEHIPRILRGDELWVQFFSEPEAGSDLAGVRTRATRQGDRWVLSGSKIWSSGAYYAGYGLCLARTDWAAPKHRGLTWFAVRVDAPGVTVRRLRQINGNSEFCAAFLDSVVVDDADVVGVVNQGWAVARTMLAGERGGGSRGAAEAGQPIGELAPDLVELATRLNLLADADVRQLIGRAHVGDVVQAELRARIVALSETRAADPGSLAAYVKLASGTFALERAKIGLRIGGAAAVAWPADAAGEGATARAFVDARRQSIAGGTNEMMRNVIGERVLGLPREPSFDTDIPFSEVVRRSQNWQPGSRGAQ